jgi:hypothetical protein
MNALCPSANDNTKEVCTSVHNGDGLWMVELMLLDVEDIRYEIEEDSIVTQDQELSIAKRGEESLVDEESEEDIREVEDAIPQGADLIPNDSRGIDERADHRRDIPREAQTKNKIIDIVS